MVPVAVLDVGGMDQGMDQIALGVGEDMPLAALDLLACVVAARTAAFRGFDALSITPALGDASRPSLSREAISR
jgi:hypothetical protein